MVVNVCSGNCHQLTDKKAIPCTWDFSLFKARTAWVNLP